MLSAKPYRVCGQTASQVSACCVVRIVRLRGGSRNIGHAQAGGRAGFAAHRRRHKGEDGPGLAATAGLKRIRPCCGNPGTRAGMGRGLAANRQGGREEEGVDAVPANDDQTLKVQVTTPEHSAWSTLAQQSELVRVEPDVEAALESIKGAIERKMLFAGREEIVLALDATDSLRYALKGVADAFRAKYGRWAVGAGYQSIWLVGPLADLVQRLDIES